jgi:hypothetical protein
LNFTCGRLSIDVSNGSEDRKWQKHADARKDDTLEKATVVYLVHGVYKPNAPDEKHTDRSPTTFTGLPVEDQVRKKWDPRKGGLPTFSR